MSETVRSLFLKARALLDSYSEDGVIISDDDVIDMLDKSIPIADMAQKKLHRIGKLYNTKEISNKPAPNLLGNLSNFDLVDYIGTAQYYPNETGVVGALAYYMESDGDDSGTGKMEIEENQGGVWTVINTDTFPSGVTSLTAYSGVITPLDTSNYIRMKFSGTKHYRHINRCLYSYPFAANRIPVYGPWIKVDMPSNFQSRAQIIEETSTGQYQNMTGYKWEGWKTLVYDYSLDGNIRIVYRPVPTTLTGIDDAIEIDDITAQGIVYYMAARLAPFENKELVNFFEDEFNALMVDNSKPQPATEVDIIDAYPI